MDSSYCLIQIVDHYKIVCCFFQKTNCYCCDYPICFTAYNYGSINKLMTQHNYIYLLSIQHIQYISKELYKANLCLLLSQNYIQN
uniref:DUF4346 domain-containing protein n=1 Tax=Gracilaria salicornia TaxID=172968 RepID=W8DX90_9FLOR|nr:hypothetical protein [Gracilaria salicornia]AHH24654.1 hypothetical protein [Gracilaria salicornia]